MSADTVVMCKDCGWPVEHRHHDDVHGRMKRYRFQVDGMNFVSVLPWEAWSAEWRSWFAGLVHAQRGADQKNGLQRTTVIFIDNYSSELDSIRWHGEVELV